MVDSSGRREIYVLNFPFVYWKRPMSAVHSQEMFSFLRRSRSSCSCPAMGSGWEKLYDVCLTDFRRWHRPAKRCKGTTMTFWRGRCSSTTMSHNGSHPDEWERLHAVIVESLPDRRTFSYWGNLKQARLARQTRAIMAGRFYLWHLHLCNRPSTAGPHIMLTPKPSEACECYPVWGCMRVNRIAFYNVSAIVSAGCDFAVW